MALDLAWAWIATALTFSVSFLASLHALFLKRDVRSTLGWMGVIWLVPFFGAVLYLLLGVNRIQRRALALRSERSRYLHAPAGGETQPPAVPAALPDLARLVGEVTGRPLLPGNSVLPLVDGDVAYPEMLRAIDEARSSLSLMTYIFDDDEVGRAFVERLAAAKSRGVQVRVLIDAAGVRYSHPPVDRRLRAQGIPTARFLPVHLTRLPYFNLRNHRKLLVADGRLAFTGGMNIRRGHRLVPPPPHPVQDLHFRLEGPIVRPLQEAFAEDWEFTTGEALPDDPWFPELEARGQTLARAVTDGPDEDLFSLSLTLLGALASAQRSIRIATPYFLPDSALAQALGVAALRGVSVDILLPEHGNLPVVEWAMWAQIWQVLDHGCRVWLSPAPFDHSKLVVVDEAWSFFGSTNWDPRSLRLNFELNVEAYDPALAARLVELFERKRIAARRLHEAELAELPFQTRLRNALARLFTPYL